MNLIYERLHYESENRHKVIVPPAVTQISHITNIEEKALKPIETITSE